MKFLSAKLSLLVLVTFLPVISFAQCAMCKATAETSGYGSSLNSGILYLLIMPFLVIFGGGLFWYFNRKKFISSEIDNEA